MEVVQELLDAPKLKKKKKASSSAKFYRPRNVRPRTSQEHGPKAFVWIRCPVSQPLYFSRSLQQECTFFFAAQMLLSETYQDPAGRMCRRMCVVEALFRTSFCMKTSRFYTECGLAALGFSDDNLNTHFSSGTQFRTFDLKLVVRTNFRTFEGLKTKLHWNSMASRQK